MGRLHCKAAPAAPARLRAPALLLAVLAAPAAAPAPVVQGFVSAQLLASWCEGRTRLDTEACLSYLRGTFDTLNALRTGDVAGRLVDLDGEAIGCIPPSAPVTQLRNVYRRYAAENPGSMDAQAAVVLLRALAAAFPCAPKGAPAGGG